MSQPNFPAPKEKTPLKGASRIQRYSMVGGVATLTGAVGFYLLTQHVVFSLVLAAFGGLLLVARLMIRKSLALTATHDWSSVDSIDQQLENMKVRVSKCKFLENVETEGARAASLAVQLVLQFKSLKKILSQKFDPSELTFSRYLSSIETACLAICENLDHAQELLENLNLTYKEDAESPAWKETLSRARGIFDSSDVALNGLADLQRSINEITTHEKYRGQLEDSMLEIRKLAERAKSYSKP